MLIRYEEQALLKYPVSVHGWETKLMAISETEMGYQRSKIIRAKREGKDRNPPPVFKIQYPMKI